MREVENLVILLRMRCLVNYAALMVMKMCLNFLVSPFSRYHIFIIFAASDGAFYLYVDVSEITEDSESLCDDILKEAHVAITPGTDFDVKRGKKYVRFSYAASTERIQEGLSRLQKWWNRR